MDHLYTNKEVSYNCEQELEKFRNKMLTMGGMAEKQVHRALVSLIKYDQQTAHCVVEGDHHIYDMETLLDEHCSQIIAESQPKANDLRVIIATMKVVSSLVQIGKEAAKIAKLALYLAKNSYSGTYYKEFEKLGSWVLDNLTQALNALARYDVKQALRVAKSDTVIDVTFEKLNEDVIKYMRLNPVELEHLIRLSWAAKAVEKIGDHTTKICQYVIFLVKGKDDIQHIDIESIRKGYL